MQSKENVMGADRSEGGSTCGHAMHDANARQDVGHLQAVLGGTRADWHRLLCFRPVQERHLCMRHNGFEIRDSAGCPVLQTKVIDTACVTFSA